MVASCKAKATVSVMRGNRGLKGMSQPLLVRVNDLREQVDSAMCPL